MPHQNLLQVNDLSIHFETMQGRVQAVDGISFGLRKGETLGIVGESGSGKSITSLAIMGLLSKSAKMDGGEIIYQKKDGETIHLENAEPRIFQQVRGSEMAMVFQEPMTSLNPVFCCGDQVMEAILTHQKLDKTSAKQRVISLFQKVKLQEPERIYKSFPHQLSGGQRQRVMIAMALSCEPSILIADEPTSALDVTIQRSILDLINELKSEMDGATIFISHDLKVVAEIADRVLVMQKGKIVEQGSVDQVFNRPKEEYTKRLLNDSLGQEPLQKRHKTELNPILQIRNLQTWFSQKKSFFGKTLQHIKAVDGVSFEVFEGETLGLVGESGSGKTTLGRTLLHLQKPTGGEVIYNGQSLLEVPDNEWKSIRQEFQIIFQDPYSSLNPRQMIGPAIMEPMKVHGIGNSAKEREQMAKGLLQKVGLEEVHFWRFPKEFSGGQRQRICIAKALAVRPRIIICDECVSALDVTVQAKILALLKQLQVEEKLTYLFISHDLSVIRQISDRVAVMQAGRIVELEEVSSIYNNPKNVYTRQLIEAIPGRK